MNNIELKKEYRGLQPGTEFTYDKKLKCWTFEKKEEDISDNAMVDQRVRVRFSDSFVKANKDLFDIPEDENKEAQELISKYEALLEKVQQELDELKKIK